MAVATDDQVKVWQAALSELEVTLSKANFTTWFKNTRILAVNGDDVTVGVPNTFAQEWLSKKYHDKILQTLRQYYPDARTIHYEVATIGQPDRPATPTEPLPSAPHLTHAPAANSSEEVSGLNSHYTFDTFIVGSANRLAHAAATAVAKNPGAQQYNPLYFYGGVGLGKTHLLHAIGNAIKAQSPDKTILYAPCERFTSEFIEALKGKKLEAFKRRYRNADVLLIDDIQFLSGKEGMQEEFFHTFNTLHQTNRQIVMTSDSRPQSIPELAPRLSSRLGWGMVADFQTPDSETRQAILRHKCDERSFPLGDDAIAYLADHVQSNIRELEGALNGVIAHCELYGVQPSLTLIERLVSESGAERRSLKVNADAIFQTIAEFFSLEIPELLGKRRHKELVYPRQIAMYLMRNELNYSFPKIGKALGGKDHTTVMHGVEKINRELKTDENLQRELALIKERLYTST